MLMGAKPFEIVRRWSVCNRVPGGTPCEKKTDASDWHLRFKNVLASQAIATVSVETFVTHLVRLSPYRRTERWWTSRSGLWLPITAYITLT